MGKRAEVSAAIDRAELESAVEMGLSRARDLGADAAECGASVDVGLGVTVRLGEVETLEYRQDRGIGITVFMGQRKGVANTSDLSPQAIQEAVQKACDIARFTQPDPHAGLPPADRLARDIPDLDLCHPWALEPDEAIELARRCENAARDEDERIDNSDGASVDTQHGVRAYGNSHGFIGSFEGTTHGISCSVLARDEKGMQRDFWYTTAREHGALQSPEAVGREAAQRTLRRLGGRRLSTRKAPVLFVPQLARGLIATIVGAASGPAQYRQASWLLEGVGKRVLPDWMDLVEHPHVPRALGSAPFDAEGVAIADNPLVEEGHLSRYVLDSYSARRLGLETTGNAGGVHNLTLECPKRPPEALLATMGTGLIVNELMGQGVNGVTGDYSRGAAGFWVEGGEIAFPVEEITIAGNLRDMLGHVLAAGDDVDWRGNILCGSLLLEEMTIAGE
ncbi:metalloprotease PmbA [Natronospira bacteriovora]|uniref:Metalloprotease PmbA n=1 Tax=Natronospira bacteriovora TaxID=3069753 RepID=A0ABU0W7D7_9GAMM|nr:metalloprotease PmbA [Natronospira sp. AB-CW4]MDQ2069937.1 metalloprotease PmbA [Natronospira sp. AB-CW4]